MSMVVMALITSCNRGLSLCLSSYGRVYAADPYAAALAAAPAAAAAYGVGAMVSHASACLSHSGFCLQVSNRNIFFTGHSLQRRIQPVFAILTPLIHFQIFGLSDTSPTAADLWGKNQITLLDKKKKKKRNFRICYKLWIRNATLNQYIKEGGFFFFF